MFEELLSGIFDKKGLTDVDAKQQQYLKQLRPYGKKLWQSYHQQPVTVDYSQAETQEAYLLRYFPSYTLPVEKELDALREKGHTLPEVELLDVCFFGCGPGPELIGLIKHLRTSNAKTTMLTAKMVDVASETWSRSREIVQTFLAEPFWDPGLLEIQPITASLSDTKAIEEIHLEGCHFAVIQNCLNEVPRKDVVENIMNAFSKLLPGAIALVIDRANYEATKNMLEQMADSADKRYERLTLISELAWPEISCEGMLNGVPDIIDNNLYYTDVRGKSEAERNGLTYAKKIDNIGIVFQVGDLPTDNS